MENYGQFRANFFLPRAGSDFSPRFRNAVVSWAFKAAYGPSVRRARARSGPARGPSVCDQRNVKLLLSPSPLAPLGRALNRARVPAGGVQCHAACEIMTEKGARLRQFWKPPNGRMLVQEPSAARQHRAMKKAGVSPGLLVLRNAEPYSRLLPRNCSRNMNRLMKSRYSVRAPMIADLPSHC